MLAGSWVEAGSSSVVPALAIAPKLQHMGVDQTIACEA